MIFHLLFYEMHRKWLVNSSMYEVNEVMNRINRMNMNLNMSIVHHIHFFLKFLIPLVKFLLNIPFLNSNFDQNVSPIVPNVLLQYPITTISAIISTLISFIRLYHSSPHFVSFNLVVVNAKDRLSFGQNSGTGKPRFMLKLVIDSVLIEGTILFYCFKLICLTFYLVGKWWIVDHRTTYTHSTNLIFISLYYFSFVGLFKHKCVSRFNSLRLFMSSANRIKIGIKVSKSINVINPFHLE